ncbi:hypothetical protein G9A89_005560 [Geosiphon pyriformis]|nr:hypothetical protein G9A89_005560 [Geosiphon pyriformis]
MDKYLLESITAAILLPFSTIGKTLQEILPIDKNLSYGRQLELYSCLEEIIEDMKLMKKTTSEIQAEILGIIRLDISRKVIIDLINDLTIDLIIDLINDLIIDLTIDLIIDLTIDLIIDLVHVVRHNHLVIQTFSLLIFMTTIRAKSKKVANSTFSILSLAVSGSFSSFLAGSSFPVKVSSKRHIWISLSVVFTTSKSPKIFNNRPVSKLVFLALTTSTTTTTTTTTASQIIVKAKNSKKQQQTVATAMVTPNFFVVSDEILGKIFTAAASPLSDMDGNNKAKQSIILDDLKDWTDQIEIESTASPSFSGAVDGVVISDEVFLTTLKIVQSSSIISVFSPFLSVVLHDMPLSTFFDDIKIALGIFGVVTFVKLKPTGLWQYAVVHFKDIFFATTVFIHWSVLIRKDNIRILSVINQNNVISSRDTFKAKLVNLSFGCTVFKISNLVSQVDLNYLAVNCKILPFLPPKFFFNTFGGSKVFKFLFTRSKSYAKAAAFLVPPVVAAANMNLNLGSLFKTATPMLPAVFFAFNFAVKSRLTSLESHLSELSMLIKSLIKPVGALVVLVTKLLSTLTAMDVLLTSFVHFVTFKITKSLVVSESGSFFVVVALCDVSLGVSAANIKLPAGVWQYVVVYFKELDAAAFFALVTFDSQVDLNSAVVKMALLRCQEVNHLVVNCKVSPFSFLKASKMFKTQFVGGVSYVKALAFLNSSEFPLLTAPTSPSMIVGNPIVSSRLASVESNLVKFFVLIESIVKPVGFLVKLFKQFINENLVSSSKLGLRVNKIIIHLDSFSKVVGKLGKEVVSLKKKYYIEDIDMSDNSKHPVGLDDETIDIKTDALKTAKWLVGLVPCIKVYLKEVFFNIQYDKTKPFFNFEATVGPNIAIMKKVTKESGSGRGFKPVLSRKKRKGVALKEGVGGKGMLTMVPGGCLWGSETDDITKSESIDMEKECLVEETSFDYGVNGTIANGNHDQMSKEPGIKTKKALGKPLEKIDFSSHNNDDDIFLDILLKLLPSLKNLVIVSVRKSFALNIGLDKVLIMVRKLFSKVNGFGRAFALSKFSKIIHAFFTSKASLVQATEKARATNILAVVVKKIPVGTSAEAVCAAFFEFGSVAVVKFAQSNQTDLVTARWSILIKKNAIRVAKSANLHWSYLDSVKYAKCESLSHTSLNCFVDEKISPGGPIRKILSNDDKSKLAFIYARCSAPIFHPISFGSVLWTNIVGRSSFSSLSVCNGSASSSFSLEMRPTLMVSIELNNRFAALEYSLTSLIEHIDKLAKRLDSLGPMVS